MPSDSASESDSSAYMWKFDRHGGPPLAHSELAAKDERRGTPEVAEAAAWIKQHVRWVGQAPATVSPCVYTMTRDEELILDCIPGRPSIAVGAGFSGHGFKLAPVRMVACTTVQHTAAGDHLPYKMTHASVFLCRLSAASWRGWHSGAGRLGSTRRRGRA